MRKILMLIMGAALVLALGLGDAMAVTWPGAIASEHNSSLVEKVGCVYPGLCPSGQRWYRGQCVDCPTISCSYPKCLVRTPVGTWECKRLNGVPPNACPRPWRR